MLFSTCEDRRPWTGDYEPTATAFVVSAPGRGPIGDAGRTAAAPPLRHMAPWHLLTTTPTSAHDSMGRTAMTDDDATSVTEEHATSRDGTRIGYLRQGSGPAVVLVQGAMGVAEHYSELAGALAPRFTVLSMDRRGRGRSPKPYDAGHDIARDVEDIEAVLAATGASQVFGLSSGAVITLQAARTLPGITRAAVYEPPFYPDGIAHVGVQRLNAEIERGDLASALITSLRTAQTAPAPLRVLPLPLARRLAVAVLAVDDRRPSAHARLRDLLPGVRYDFRVVAGLDGKMSAFASLDKPVLLISGSRSPTFLRRSVLDLERALPRSSRVELPGLSHSGPWNASRGGRPRDVAAALEHFFT